MTDYQTEFPMNPSEEEPMDMETAVRRLAMARDSRFSLEAYLFLFEALEFSVKHFEKNPRSNIPEHKHVTGKELLEGIKLYARAQFGRLAPTVFRNWGLKQSSDFGEMVFNLVETGLMSKTEKDSRDDFSNGFDFDEAFNEPISLRH